MSNILEQKNKKVPFLIRFIATGFFSGYSRIAPGTAGSLAALAFYAIPGFENYLPVAILTSFFPGVFTANRMEQHFGKDPSVVVIDEIAGMWISLLFIPKSIALSVIAFFFFRVYDIFKPPPARQVEAVGNGWGVMLDDVAAGIYANISVRLILFIFPALSR